MWFRLDSTRNDQLLLLLFFIRSCLVKMTNHWSNNSTSQISRQQSDRDRRQCKANANDRCATNSTKKKSQINVNSHLTSIFDKNSFDWFSSSSMCEDSHWLFLDDGRRKTIRIDWRMSSFGNENKWKWIEFTTFFLHLASRNDRFDDQWFWSSSQSVKRNSQSEIFLSKFFLLKMFIFFFRKQFVR